MRELQALHREARESKFCRMGGGRGGCGGGCGGRGGGRGRNQGNMRGTGDGGDGADERRLTKRSRPHRGLMDVLRAWVGLNAPRKYTDSSGKELAVANRRLARMNANGLSQQNRRLRTTMYVLAHRSAFYSWLP